MFSSLIVFGRGCSLTKGAAKHDLHQKGSSNTHAHMGVSFFLRTPPKNEKDNMVVFPLAALNKTTQKEYPQKKTDPCGT